MTTATTSYVVNYADGGTSEIWAKSDADAIKQALALPRLADAYVGDWQEDGTDDDGETVWACLLWASEEGSENDPGAKSIAKITHVE